MLPGPTSLVLESMVEASGRRARWERILGFAGAGALATLAGAWLQPRLEGGGMSPGPPEVWVADRDGGRVLGLDPEGFHTRAAAIKDPLELAARGDGGLWVLAGSDSPGDPVQRLLRLTDRGEVATELPVQGASGLVALGGRDALLVAGPPGARALTRVDGFGEVIARLPLGPGATVAAGSAGILVSDESGFGVPGGPGELLPAGRSLGPLASRADGWWAVERGRSGGALLRLDRNLRRVVSRPLVELGLSEEAGLHLVPSSAGDLWILDPTGVAVRVGPGGRVHARGRLLLPGLEGGVATTSGSLWAIVPGAVVRLDRSGRSVPGQGGFDFLAAVAARSD